MADNNNVLLNNLATLSQPENFQKYVLGTKSNGQPRAIYDVVKDYTQPKHNGKKKGKKKYQQQNGVQLLLTTSKKKKKKKKHKKDKYWHI